MAIMKTQQIRAHLEAERKRIAEELAISKASQSMEDRREGSPFGKREEEATESMELEKRLTLENRLQLMLTEVEKAIVKLENGTYGICDMCNTHIDPARMEALPQAILCMNCRQNLKNAKAPII